MAPELTEETLLAAQSGEQSAVNALYIALAPSVLGYLTAKGASDPEGATSDVFLAIIRRLPAITGGVSGLRTFAFSVAHARIVDEHRRRARRPAEVPFELEHDTRSHPAAEDEALRLNADAQVRALLQRLPADQAEVLTLRVLADLSVSEVAEVMGRSPGAIKQLQRRGLLALRALLAGDGVTT